MIVLDYVLGYPRIILELFSVLFLKESLCDLEQPNYKKANRDVFFSVRWRVLSKFIRIIYSSEE